MLKATCPQDPGSPCKNNSWLQRYNCHFSQAACNCNVFCLLSQFLPAVQEFHALAVLEGSDNHGKKCWAKPCLRLHALEPFIIFFLRHTCLGQNIFFFKCKRKQRWKQSCLEILGLLNTPRSMQTSSKANMQKQKVPPPDLSPISRTEPLISSWHVGWNLVCLFPFMHLCTCRPCLGPKPEPLKAGEKELGPTEGVTKSLLLSDFCGLW